MSMNKGSILLVDDEPSLSAALTITLESLGFMCVTAMTMSEGVAILSSSSIDAVVTDIMMPSGPNYPDLDSSEAGFEFIRLIRERWPGLPVVCLSVIGDQDKIRSLATKGVVYLRKGETPLATAVDVISDVAMGRRGHGGRNRK